MSLSDDLPKSMPITGPLIFLSPSSDFRANVEENGLRRRVAGCVAGVVARGSFNNKLASCYAMKGQS